MKLLIDFSPIKSGGGAQLALNFLNYIQKTDINFCILVSDKFPYIDRIDNDKDVIISPSSYYCRFLFENFNLKSVLKSRNITHIYTFFGPGLPSFKGIKQVVSVAYPIICNDESPYWTYISKTEYIKKKALNFLRKRRLSNADFLLFETEIMQQRCTNVLGFNLEKTRVIPPSPTSFLKPSVEIRRNETVKFLLLSGLDSHKNIWRLIEVLPLIKSKGLNVKFVISCNEVEFKNKFSGYINGISEGLVDDYFDFIGNISSDQIQSVYDTVDVMLNISDLESFSNNYMEAWRAKKPILASDTDFARSICGGSAIYTNPHNLDDLSYKIAMFACSISDMEAMIRIGEEKLDLLPTLDERLHIITEIMRCKS
ncbi:glycosyltransferase [Vibrio cyclitrophicus]